MFSILFEMGYLKEEPSGKLPTTSLEVKPLPQMGTDVKHSKNPAIPFWKHRKYLNQNFESHLARKRYGRTFP
jgi:hypothetical protein